MKIIHRLIHYEYCTYSLTGIEEAEAFYYENEKTARQDAEQQGLKIVENCHNPNTEVTLEEVKVIPEGSSAEEMGYPFVCPECGQRWVRESSARDCCRGEAEECC